MKKHVFSLLLLLIASIICLAPAVDAADDEMPKEPSLALVIDDTGSMGSALAAVKKSMREAIDQIVAKDFVFPLTALYTFKDDVTPRIITNDPEKLMVEVDKLEAEGGDDYPEASYAALMEAGKKLIDFKSLGSSRKAKVFLVTDAPSRDDGPTSKDVAELYKSKGIELHSAWTDGYSFEDYSSGLDGLAKAVEGSTLDKTDLGTDEGTEKFKEIMMSLVTETAAEETKEPKPEPKSDHSSSGGCDAGAASVPLLLLSAAGALTKRSKKW